MNAALSTYFADVKRRIEAAAPAIVRQQAATGLALVRLRVQQVGLKGAKYSANLIPTYLFARQALNAGERNYIKKHKLGNWAGLKAAGGRQSAFVDLTHSNRMWNSLTTEPGASSGGVFTARTVASDQEGADKVKRNRERYGDFLALLPAERAEVEQVGVVAIKRLLEAPTA